jgi:metal-sulfur cluster biosynthetic enzyme
MAAEPEQNTPNQAESAAPDQTEITTQAEGASPIDQDAIIEALRECYDPEIPVNIVDLGLIYEVIIGKEEVKVIMTLTAMGCLAAPEVMNDVEMRMLQVPGVKKAEVELTFDPPWSPDRMSEDAKWELGIA